MSEAFFALIAVVGIVAGAYLVGTGDSWLVRAFGVITVFGCIMAGWLS